LNTRAITCYNTAAVKDTLLAVIIFCLVLAVVAAFCTLAFAVYLIGSRLFLFPAVAPEMLLKVVPAAFRQVFLPAVLLSLFFALVRMRRKPGLVFLSYLLLGALAFGALYFGPQLVAAPLNAEIAKVRAESVVGLRDLAYPRQLIPLEGAYLYFDRKEGADLVDGFLVDDARPAPRVDFFDRAPVTTGADGARLGLPGPAGAKTLAPQAAESAPFAPDTSVQSTFAFFQSLNDRFLAFSGERTGAALVVCLVVVLVVLSSSVFLRVTRWPLANVFIALLVLCLILAFYNFLINQFLVEVKKLLGESFWTTLAPKGGPLAAFFGESFWLTIVPNGVLAFLSLVFFLFDFVFLPERKRERPDA
jgi:hypothetical protein